MNNVIYFLQKYNPQIQAIGIGIWSYIIYRNYQVNHQLFTMKNALPALFLVFCTISLIGAVKRTKNALQNNPDDAKIIDFLTRYGIYIHSVTLVLFIYILYTNLMFIPRNNFKIGMSVFLILLACFNIYISVTNKKKRP